MTRRLQMMCACVAYLFVAAPFVAGAGPTIDGLNIPSEFGDSAKVAQQRYQTQFGDDGSGDQWGFGSELDELFVDNDADNLYVGLTGNLENNGNCIVLFIDVDGTAGGVNTLYTKDFGAPIGDLPRYLTGDAGGDPGLDFIQFDAGFAPDYVLGLSGGSPLGSQTRTYYLVNWTTLGIGGDDFNHDNEVAGMITTGDPTASGPSGTLGDFLSTASLGILGAADNTNTLGVGGGTGLWDIDPNTATTGFEFAIPLSLLGVGVDDDVCMFALVSGTTGWISNQLLPTIDDPNVASFENIGNRNGGVDLLDFGDLAGDQFVCYTIAAGGCPNPGASGAFCDADIDGSGDCIIGLGDLGVLLANYGMTSGATHDMGDLDPPGGDGAIGLGDLGVLLAQYGDDCN